MSKRSKQLVELALLEKTKVITSNVEVSTSTIIVSECNENVPQLSTANENNQFFDTVEDVRDSQMLTLTPTMNPEYDTIPQSLNNEDHLPLNAGMASTSMSNSMNISEGDMDYSSDDSVADPTYLPCVNTSSNMEETTNLDNLKNKDTRKIREDRKQKRNSGEEYSTKSGKIIKQKTQLPLPACRAKCKDKISNSDRIQIFQDYWKLGDYNKRSAYVSSLITINDKATSRPRFENPDQEKFRFKTMTYFLNVSGRRIKICKGCFLKTLGETANFVNLVAIKKSSSVSGTLVEDNRGTTIPKNKWSEGDLQAVRDHINRFPSYESHYTRKVNDKKYLSSDLTIQKMYDLYVEEFPSKHVSIRYYREEFHSLKLCFKQPKVDTCNTCDVLKIKIDICENAEEKALLIAQKNAHLEAAEGAYQQKRTDRDLALGNNKIKCLTFDLQQCLPTPALASSVAFYKRQLWTFNLTVHDNATKIATCYMWHEAIAGRGANQIASCLYKHINDLEPNVERVILYSDTCGGQNKNSHVSAMLTAAMQKKNTINSIDHKFMVPGHSHMEVDSDHSVIEKKKKKNSSQINHPYDWFQLVRSCGARFKVVEMIQSDFLDFSKLLKGPLVLRKKDECGNPFKWNEVRWLNYSNQFGILKFKKTLKDEDPFELFSLRRRGFSEVTEAQLNFNQISDTLINISEEKKKDIISLLPLIPSMFHEFYLSLPSKNTIDYDPDLIEVEEN